MKKIIAGVIVLAAVFAVVATASAQTSGYTFATNLTVGSTGADVVALQSFLESQGFLVIPTGVARGYFGGLTKAALAKYQAAKGITPAAGFFGPITRAAVNAGGVAVTPGTSVPGCPAGAAFNYMTGAPCASVPSTPSTSTTEGTLDVTLSGTPANNANIQSSIDVPVYGLTLKARIADVTVDRVDLQVKVQLTNSSGASENPSTLINTVKAWDGSNVLRTWNVTSADFVKDVNDSTVYYLRLSGLNFVVSKDSTKTLAFSFTTNSGIDTDRYVTIDGYGTNSLRAVSGANVTSYFSLDGTGFTRNQTFKKPGTASLTLSSDSSTPDSNNWKVSRTDGATGVTVGTINVKSETGDSVITDLYTTVTGTSSVGSPSTVYLYDGSRLVDSKTGTSTSGYISFTNINIPVTKDQTKTLTFKVDMPSTTGTGTPVVAGASTTITYQKPNGSTAQVSGSLSVNSQYFYAAAPQITFVSASAVANSLGQAASTTNVSGSFTLKVKPVGSSMTAFGATGGDFVISTSTTGAAPAGITKSVTVTPNDSTYAEGAEYTVNVSFLVPNSGIGATGLYTFYVKSIAWTTNDAAVTQTYGLDDFKTNAVSFTK